jgi:hypothetical protein
MTLQYTIPNTSIEYGLADRRQERQTVKAASVLIAGTYLLRFVPGVTVVQAVALTAAANAAGWQFGPATKTNENGTDAFSTRNPRCG